VYEIGSPIFEKTVIRLGNGKEFVIKAHHVSAQNKYMQSAQLNGKPLDKPWFFHADIADGGALELEMADQPNVQWGSAPQDAPPSLSSSRAPMPELATRSTQQAPFGVTPARETSGVRLAHAVTR
jgi:putative alpha-1,2-mannosidase